MVFKEMVNLKKLPTGTRETSNTRCEVLEIIQLRIWYEFLKAADIINLISIQLYYHKVYENLINLNFSSKTIVSGTIKATAVLKHFLGNFFPKHDSS